MFRSRAKGMDQLIRLARALSSPTRVAILRSLGKGETVTSTSRRFAISPSTASEHLHLLRRAGLVTARWRGRDHVFELPRDRRVGIVIYRLRPEK
jgi:DNA-binding transcriptional ArsR family regulator